MDERNPITERPAKDLYSFFINSVSFSITGRMQKIIGCSVKCGNYVLLCDCV